MSMLKHGKTYDEGLRFLSMEVPRFFNIGVDIV